MLLNYMKAMGYISVVIVFVSVSLFQGLNIFSNFWLTYWTEDPVLKNVSLSGTPDYEQQYVYYLLMYLLFGVLQGNGQIISSADKYNLSSVPDASQKSKPESKRIMTETRFTEFPALSVYSRVGISRSASETNV